MKTLFYLLNQDFSDLLIFRILNLVNPIILLILIQTNLFAQTVFTEQDKAFFSAQKPTMLAFLAKKGISQPERIAFLDIRVVENKQGKKYVGLLIEAVDADTWLNLRESYQEQFGRSLEKDIFDKLVFLCEIDAADALLSVYAKDGYQLYADLEAKKNYIFEIEETKSRAEVSKKFALPKANLPRFQTLQGEKLLENINQKIINILKNYYADKGALFHNLQFSIISQYPHDLRLKISNLKKEVFNESYYFEMIWITVHLEKEAQNKLHFDCKVDAKYGTSILLAPRNSADYKDIEEDSRYQIYINEYAPKIRDLLYQALQK